MRPRLLLELVFVILACACSLVCGLDPARAHTASPAAPSDHLLGFFVLSIFFFIINFVQFAVLCRSGLAKVICKPETVFGCHQTSFYSGRAELSGSYLQEHEKEKKRTPKINADCECPCR